MLNFVIPFSTYDIQAVSLSFRNGNSLVFEAMANGFKDESYVDEETGKKRYRTRIGYTINQEESLTFNENSNYKLQLNVFGPNGSRIASREIPVVTLEQQISTPNFVNENSYLAKQVQPNGMTSAASYNLLLDRPSINGVVLTGDRTLPEFPITDYEIASIFSKE